ncbi:bifunctional 4-hydroxy-2-oxoglutarate aldolase/2-dehydro-3-deoxy-phosphogluconate aldolase [Pseudomonas argentinensis]|uniref:2-dehydro-3-deoxy-phosphogluconate aldolase n=1 Tax=Phytopseudomonas argentinensis TaxID=289370 RepID=A0A1I3L5S2_9GAMM|nr:bifunctional 4-hydroxy-2-oxoglutarate aldolase/2-dehydro-3-deoxy-phosphogluconate aldolase [Pseudomonas argentinensis]KAB0550198.1 bifunctional 4-hydroxy-2-oxoglutarate aldolase/2-dehydro-3-deoxy-phosphogluconate aldolase [Pseudomonas argentinensis]SFI80092.1 2-keto-3-deoxy-phosphogluconate aldolase [Pseudomonas argentinensis]
MTQAISRPTLTMAEKIDSIDALCARARIMPVITIAREEDILPMADALDAGGLQVLEITLRSPHGLTAIRRLREERPHLCVGAGTVLDRHMLDAVEEAGAQFIVSPGSTDDLLRAALESPVPMLPGVASASEIMVGYALGYRRFKLFPAEVCGGTAALKALGGPFGDIRFCPTGGVGPANLQRYMALPNVMCVGGSWMLDSSNGWDAVRQASADALALLD